MSPKYDVAIIGAGPTGLFAAYQLARLAPKANIVVVSRKGNTHSEDPLSFQDTKSRNSPVSTDGLGGSGAYSDKLYFDPAGGWLEDEKKKYSDVFMCYVAELFERFGGISERDAFAVKKHFKPIPEITYKEYKRLVPITQSQYRKFIVRFAKHLTTSNVRFLTRNVIAISKFSSHRFRITLEGQEKRIEAKQVLIATGRSSTSWLQKQALVLGLKCQEPRPFFGVRIEARAESLRNLAGLGPDPKFKHEDTIFSSSQTKMHCVCTNGHVISCISDDMILVDGTRFPQLSQNTSFNVLTSLRRTLDVNRCRKIVQTVLEENAGKPVVQLMKDFRRGISTDPGQLRVNLVKPTLSNAKPGDLTHNLPFEVLYNIINFIELLRGRFPGVNMQQNLVYAPVLEWFSPVVLVNEKTGKTSVDGVFVAGDAAGISQGVVMAAASGIQTGLNLSQYV